MFGYLLTQYCRFIIFVFSDSKLTSLLENILGGNCKTRVLCCIPPVNNSPEIMSAVLTGCGMLAQVKNYPIINDCLAQVSVLSRLC